MNLPFNPRVQKCYTVSNIKFKRIQDIVYKDDFQTRVQDTCVYYIPPRYQPQNYVAVFDLDNTLTYHQQSLYVKHPDDINLIPNRMNTLQTIFKKGYTIVVMTNQATMKIEQVRASNSSSLN